MILEYDIGCLLVLLTLLQVLKTILDLLPIAPDVQQMLVTLDFEMAMWAALQMCKSRVVFSIGHRLFGERSVTRLKKLIHPFTALGAHRALIDFTL